VILPLHHGRPWGPWPAWKGDCAGDGPAALPAVSLCASNKPARALRRPRGTRPPGEAYGPAHVSGRRTARCAASYALYRQSPMAHQTDCRSPHPAGIPRVRQGRWPPHRGYLPPSPGGPPRRHAVNGWRTHAGLVRLRNGKSRRADVVRGWGLLRAPAPGENVPAVVAPWRDNTYLWVRRRTSPAARLRGVDYAKGDPVAPWHLLGNRRCTSDLSPAGVGGVPTTAVGYPRGAPPVGAPHPGLRIWTSKVR
jgi:hypothetical protein